MEMNKNSYGIFEEMGLLDPFDISENKESIKMVQDFIDSLNIDKFLYPKDVMQVELDKLEDGDSSVGPTMVFLPSKHMVR
jgi:hypothetical protein